jgi:hypothetical protein
VLDSEIGEERMREKRFSAITFAIVFCFLLAAPLIANTSFPNSNLSKDKILENSEESILESSVYYEDKTDTPYAVYVSGDYAYVADCSGWSFGFDGYRHI